ncbi:cGMP-specific 3',5'-cyclic phosphodiesterase-like [Scomber scombrus]|uniref:cGMP-specific 3',5'-cyclic phosphodiesterase-like n=1 Tax=Scomber scombrus TaxID=13677 RepID=UPI002DDB439B|nr:cGMP-specific 3',5'-cyclic phosphodiesterase-like [Scomber scombrus]
MPCLHCEVVESMEPGSAIPEASPSAGTVESFSSETVTAPPMVEGMGWFFSPLWSPRCKTRRSRFGDGMTSEQVAWLDDHSDYTRSYFLRRASGASGPQADMSPRLPRVPRSSSDHSELFRTTHGRRASSPITSSHLSTSSITDKLRPLTSNLNAPEGMDRISPDPLGGHTPYSPRSSRCSLSPFSPFSPICPCSHDAPFSPLLCPTATKTVACGYGEGCPWMMELLRGGLSWMGSVAELCQGAVLHAGELLAAEGGSLSLVKKDGSERSTLEEVTDPTSLGDFSEGLCSHAHMELMKGIMGCVLASGSPMNLRDVSEDPRFDLEDDQSLKIRSVLCVPIKNHGGEVVGVVVMINKRGSSNGSVSVFTNMDEKVLSNHMDVLGMVLDNIQLYESSRQEAKRSQALIKMAQVLSKEHHSFEVLLSKMAATIMPFTHAQYCTIFIPNKDNKISFSQVIHLECEELGSTCQIYRRERDISDVDPSYALQTLVGMETLNMSESSEGSIKSLICCPVRNERSEDVIAVCQLMNKLSRDSDEMEAFNRYDERLLEDLAVYCGLALQYVQAVQITEERRASIEVTQEVLAYHITAAEEEIQALQEVSIPSAESLHILDFHFSDFGLPEDLTTQATVRMFLDLNLVQDFKIDYKSLCQWVLTVRRGYRNNVPYHNWSHALSTAQSMFAMLMGSDELQVIFSRLEIFALMIATLNHDLDHRGVSNSYIKRSQQPLAQLYGHSSLENHHYNLCLFILNNTGSQILSGLSPEDRKTVLQMIKRAILATDLAVYMVRRKDFFSLSKKSKVSWKSDKQRDLLRSMLMTASDLSAITKPWPEQKRLANLVAMEFFAQGDKEKKEFKIKPIDIMNRENSTRLPYMQVEYIDDICYPLYKAVSKLFDTCSPMLSGCKKNRENWLHMAEEAEKETIENRCSGQSSLHSVVYCSGDDKPFGIKHFWSPQATVCTISETQFSRAQASKGVTRGAKYMIVYQNHMTLYQGPENA